MSVEWHLFTQVHSVLRHLAWYSPVTAVPEKKPFDSPDNSCYMYGISKVSPEQRTRVQMNPEAQNDIKMYFYDFYQINLCF